VIADDHPMIREMVKAILEVRQFQVAGVASDGREAVELCRDLEPDMAVLDLSMPKLNGIDAAREIKRDFAGTGIIMLSTHSDGPYILESLRVGVAGYVTKAKAASRLPQAIDAVCRGEIYVCASGSHRCMKAFLAAAEGRIPREMGTLASICLEAFLAGPEGRDSYYGELWEQEALRPASKPERSSLQLRSPFVGQREVQAPVNQYNGHALNGVILRKQPVPVSLPTCRLRGSLRRRLRPRVIERSRFLRGRRFQKRTIASWGFNMSFESPHQALT
jgi:DNA-binding NarL/FixJ family response regulator